MAFTVAAQAAGVVPANGFFDAYASDVNFLLAAYIFEDVGVTAYSGAAPFITNKSVSCRRGGNSWRSRPITPASSARSCSRSRVRSATQATALISGLRATLSGAADDQGIGGDQSTLDGGFPSPSNIVPTDPNSLAFARTPRQVLNVVYGAARRVERPVLPQSVPIPAQGGGGAPEALTSNGVAPLQVSRPVAAAQT